MSGGAPAWLHDGATAARHEVLVALDSERLIIAGHGEVPIRFLRRLDSSQMIFSRTDVKGWRLGFDEEPPPPLLWQLPAKGHYGGPIDRIGLWGFAALALIVSALVVVGVIRGLDLVARAIPYSWEQKLGDAISGDFGEHACHAPAGQKALDGLARRLSPSGKPIRIGMVDFPLVNAVALPGGRILIFRGLVDEARSPDEVAGVLAHEIGHVEHRHVMVGLLRRFGLGLLIGTGGTAAEYGQALVQSRYDRAAETEADQYSIDRLKAAGISPTATAGLFARLSKEEAGMPGVLGYLASHPPSVEREQRFAAAAKGMTATVPALTAAEWSAVRAMCAGRKS